MAENDSSTKEGNRTPDEPTDASEVDAVSEDADAPDTGQKIPPRERWTRSEKLQLIFGAWGGVLAFGGLYILYLQTEVMTRQTELMDGQLKISERAATAAKDSVDIARNALEDNRKAVEKSLAQGQQALDASIAASRLDQRAWLTVDATGLANKLAIGKTPTVLLLIKNSGRTPALDVTIESRVFTRSALTEKELSAESIGIPPSNPVMGPGGTLTVPSTSSEAICNQGQIDAVERGSHKLYAIGTIYYKDIFKFHHQTKFCFRISGTTYIKGLGMVACAVHNDAN